MSEVTKKIQKILACSSSGAATARRQQEVPMTDEIPKMRFCPKCTRVLEHGLCPACEADELEHEDTIERLRCACDKYEAERDEYKGLHAQAMDSHDRVKRERDHLRCILDRWDLCEVCGDEKGGVPVQCQNAACEPWDHDGDGEISSNAELDDFAAQADADWSLASTQPRDESPAAILADINRIAREITGLPKSTHLIARRCRCDEPKLSDVQMYPDESEVRWAFCEACNGAWIDPRDEGRALEVTEEVKRSGQWTPVAQRASAFLNIAGAADLMRRGAVMEPMVDGWPDVKVPFTIYGGGRQKAVPTPVRRMLDEASSSDQPLHGVVDYPYVPISRGRAGDEFDDAYDEEE